MRVKSWEAGKRGSREVILSRIAGLIRRVSGMPDYQAHCEHLRHCHPGSPLPSQRQFFEDFVRARYGDGPTRCC